MTTWYDVPVPHGAVDVGDWADVGTPDPFRCFTGSPRVINLDDRDVDVEVRVDGTQYINGVDRGIAVHIFTDDRLTSAQARQLAAALIETADEVDRWAAR